MATSVQAQKALERSFAQMRRKARPHARNLSHKLTGSRVRRTVEKKRLSQAWQRKSKLSVLRQGAGAKATCGVREPTRQLDIALE